MKVAIVFAALVALAAAGSPNPIVPEAKASPNPIVPEVIGSPNPILPEANPIVPEYKPLPEGLYIPPEVHSHVLDFPSSDNPMIRFHINVKGTIVDEMKARRIARSILGGGLLLPPWILNPQGAVPLPERIPKPEILPEIAPEVPETEDKSIVEHVFRWPDAENQLVKLKVRVNEDAFKQQPKILPARSVDPVIPMPEMKPIKKPDIEVFLDIGEQVKYW